MSIQRYINLLKQAKSDRSFDKYEELQDLYSSIDKKNSSKEEFLTMIELEITNNEELDIEIQQIFEESIDDFLRHYTTLVSDDEKRSFSKSYLELFDTDKDILSIRDIKKNLLEQILCAAVDADDEDLLIFMYYAFTNDCDSYEEVVDMFASLQSNLLRTLLSTTGVLIFSPNCDSSGILTNLWMGYTTPLSDKQRQFLDKVRPLDVAVELSQQQALKLLKALDDAGDIEGHAHIIHSLLNTSVVSNKKSTDSRLANAIVTGAIKNEKVNITLFADTSQSAYLLQAPFKTLKNEMKEGNERAIEILQTILTDKSWKRLSQPRKKGKMAWLWRKVTGQSGKFIPKPRKK